MKKNGFTLIELIGSVVILALIALVALPSIINLLRTGQRKLTSSVKQVVESAAIDYVNNNLDDYPKNNVDKSIDPLECNGNINNCLCGSKISYKTLEDQGYVDKSIREKNSNAITDKSYINIYCNSERYKAKFYGGEGIDREITVKFKKGDNVSKIGMTSQTCLVSAGDSSCSVTAPSITPYDGFSSIGWNRNKNATSGTEEGESINVSSDVTYYAIAIDNKCPVCNLMVKSATYKNVTVDANCKDASGIKYQYSTDNGSNYSNGSATQIFDTFRISNIRLKASDSKGNSCVKSFSKGNLDVAYEIITNALEQKYDELNNKEESFSQNEILNKMYPVGSIYISQSSTNPSTTLGGTWVRYAEGRTLVGAGNGFNANSTGGNKTVTLNASNLPAHNHEYTPQGKVNSWFSGKSFSVTAGNHSHTILYNTTAGTGETWGASLIGSEPDLAGGFQDRFFVSGGSISTSYVGNHSLTYKASGDVSSSFSGNYGTTTSTGSGQPLNIMNPYITVYMWRRTA